MRTALTIAGSDSGGGAGIQADLKTFSALGVYGMSAITAVTAQNTQEVRSVQSIDPGIVGAQIDVLFEDMPIHAVKIGMLSNPDIIKVVANRLEYYRPKNIVIDPVMISKGGHSLLEETAISLLTERLLPLATVLTPNIPEAEALTGNTVESHEDMELLCEKLQARGTESVLLKGGHFNGNPDDVFYNGKEFTWLKGERIITKNTHGTGCTLSSAIAANLAREEELLDSIKLAKQYITGAIRESLEIGKGHGPTHHFHSLYKDAGVTMERREKEAK
jgi:hydroxymethylpyrimidine/phosphomethylpyrimidine kinase